MQVQVYILYENEKTKSEKTKSEKTKIWQPWLATGGYVVDL
jgi:hypothetical protein